MATTAEDESVLPLEPEHQRKFDTTLRATNALVKQDSFMGAANKDVTKLVLRRAFPDHISLSSLMSKLENLQVCGKNRHTNNKNKKQTKTLWIDFVPKMWVSDVAYCQRINSM